MDTPEIKSEIKVMSRSAFHNYMTQAAEHAEGPKSSFNPYRKKAGIFNILSLDNLEKALTESVKEVKTQANQTLSQPSVLSTFEPSR